MYSLYHGLLPVIVTVCTPWIFMQCTLSTKIRRCRAVIHKKFRQQAICARKVKISKHPSAILVPLLYERNSHFTA